MTDEDGYHWTSLIFRGKKGRPGQFKSLFNPSSFFFQFFYNLSSLKLNYKYINNHFLNYMSSAIVVATIALQGAAVGVSFELALRSVFQANDKVGEVRLGKFFLGFFMAIKSLLFLSFHAR